MKQDVKFDNFVGIFDGFFTTEYCQAMIEYFEKLDAIGKTWQRDYTTEMYKSDTSSSLLHPDGI